MNYRESAEELMESMKVLRKNTALQCLSDMSQGEMAVLCYLLFSHNGASAGELTAEFKVRSSRTAAILNGLERKGYAVRSSDPEDKRRVRVYITEKGKKYHREYCRTTKNSNTRAISLSKAKSMGYEACKVCNP